MIERFLPQTKMQKDIALYKQAMEINKTPRINWKEILGCHMGVYVRNHWHLSEEELVHRIVTEAYKHKDRTLKFWDFHKVIENIKIGVGARLAEIRMYGGGTNK